MEKICLVVTFICTLIACFSQAKATELRRLKIKVNKLSRKHNSLQSDVDDIWATLITTGINAKEYDNKTMTDYTDTNTPEFISMVEGTLAIIQGLKTEVEHMVVTSRNGLKHEKSWQREAIRNITKVCKDCRSSQIEEKHDTQQTIRGMQEQIKQNQLKLSTIEMENQELRNIIERVQMDNQRIESTLDIFEAENKALKNAIREVQRIDYNTEHGQTTCDENWKEFNGHCYLAEPRGGTWDRASADCKAMDAYLLEINTDAEIDFLWSQLIPKKLIEYWLWAGATNRKSEGTFVYEHSGQEIPNKYWASGQPNGGDDHCIEMFYDRHSTPFYDTPCSQTRLYVCEKS